VGRLSVSVGSRWSAHASIWYSFLPLICTDQIPFFPTRAGRRPSQALVFVSLGLNFLHQPVCLELFPSLLRLWSHHRSQRRGSVFVLVLFFVCRSCRRHSSPELLFPLVRSPISPRRQISFASLLSSVSLSRGQAAGHFSRCSGFSRWILPHDLLWPPVCGCRKISCSVVGGAAAEDFWLPIPRQE
jgi:hypothetical protein